MWSADGSTLAWKDRTGIWRWNIFDEESPQQILTADEIDEQDMNFPALLDLSTYGRYVRVGQPDTWTLIDSTNGQTFTNAIAAPSEQFLIFFSDGNGEIRDWSSESSRCEPPLRETCAVYLDTPNLQDMFPYQLNLIGRIACSDESEACMIDAVSWHPSIGETGYIGGRYIQEVISDFRQITYDAQYNQPALLVGDYHIYFDFYSDYYLQEEEYRPYLDIVDLEDQVDSPITHIEWGQPIFYDIYNLTTVDHLPQ